MQLSFGRYPRVINRIVFHNDSDSSFPDPDFHQNVIPAKAGIKEAPLKGALQI